MMSNPSENALPSRVFDSTLLLCCAALLIFNSHLEAYYPRSWMAGDGLLGNTMFFVLSGLGIQSSLLAKKTTFVPYLCRRFLRLYPTLWVALLALGASQAITVARTNPAGIFGHFIWPTDYTYVEVIIPLYLALYVVCASRSKGVVAAVTVCLAGIYLVLALLDARTIPAGVRLSLGVRPKVMHDAYYATATFSGAWLALSAWRPKLSFWRTASLGLLLASYFACKFDMVARGQFASFYPVLQILTLASCVAALLSLGAPAALDRMPAILRRIVRAGAVLTLEIYVVHELLLARPFFQLLRFPLNILVLLAVTIAISVVVHWVAGVIRKQFEHLIFAGRP